jgi:hypothetical protein
MTCRLSLIVVVFLCGWATAQDLPDFDSSTKNRPQLEFVNHPHAHELAAGEEARSQRRMERLALRVRRRAAVAEHHSHSEKNKLHPLQPRIPTERSVANKPAAPPGPAPPDPELALDKAPAGTSADDASSSATDDEEVEASSARPEPPAEADSSTAETSSLPPHLMKLKAKIQTARDIYRSRMLNTAEHCHWSIMHSLIAYGVEKQVRIGSPRGKAVNAIGWICYNYPCRGETLFYLDQGNIRGRRGPGRQGHEGQFLAMLAQSRVKIDYPMKIEGRDFTVRDLVRSEMATCQAGSELTFKLIGLAHYLDIDERWTSDNGERWNIERMVVEEIRQPINGAACGGTHRLFGLAYGVHQRRKSNLPLTGGFARADQYLKQYHKYTFHLQNRDGSFSTEFFAGRGFDTDLKKRILTSGHVAEWLAFSLPEDQLHRPEMVRAIDYLCNLLIRGQNYDWEVGPLGHTLHALSLYDKRALSKPRSSDVLAALVADDQ